MKKPLLKWLVMGLLCAMFSVVQVSADEASVADAVAQANQILADNPEMSGEDLVNALIEAGIDPADAAAAAVQLKPADAANIKAAAAAAPGADVAAIEAAVAAILASKEPTTIAPNAISPIGTFGPNLTPTTGAGAGGGGASPSK